MLDDETAPVIQRFGVNVMGLDGSLPVMEGAHAAIRALETFLFETLGLKSQEIGSCTLLKELEIKDNIGIMNIRSIITVALALSVSAVCLGGVKQKKVMHKNSKALVVFFSHAGDNYSVGNIKVGNTKIVADYITELAGADQFEIVTHKYDGMAYQPLCDLAKEEQRKGELPPYEGSVDVSKYDTVFIGGPVWWGTYPQVMFTFFSKVDLNGKTVIPFTTHEGSGLGQCVRDVRKAYPKANVTGQFSIYGHDVRDGKARVEKWLKTLGY